MKKLSLKELEVNSFVTELNESENKTVEGGVIVTLLPVFTAGIASYVHCKRIGEDIGKKVSQVCGDSFGFVCTVLTV